MRRNSALRRSSLATGRVRSALWSFCGGRIYGILRCRSGLWISVRQSEAEAARFLRVGCQGWTIDGCIDIERKTAVTVLQMPETSYNSVKNMVNTCA